jgi:adenylate cyclase
MGRKLAAILVADFVGSTAAMQSDEERALAQVANLLDIVSAHVAEHEGRVFNTAGDSILAEFASPVSALRAAMEARMAIAGTPGLSAESTRFGLHVADVVAVGTDLRGDGVNVTARIQSAAEPGQILVSGLLFDHVKRNSPCGFDDLGAVDLKGLEQPVQLFRVTGQMDRNIGLIVPARNPLTGNETELAGRHPLRDRILRRRGPGVSRRRADR